MNLFSYGYRCVVKTGNFSRFLKILTSKRHYKDYNISVDLPNFADLKTKLSESNSRSKNGVAILLGWTGSSPKSLYKYGEVYLNRQQAVVKVCPSAILILKLGSRKVVQNFANNVFTTLRDNNLHNEPLFFHAFSNGGSMLYCALLKNWLKRNGNMAIVGTIFDSAPAAVNVIQIKRAISESISGNTIVKSSFGCLGVLWAYSSLLWNCALELLQLGNLSDTENCRFFFYQTLMTLPNFGPELFLFSKSDRVVNYTEVQSYISKRRMAGVDIKYHMWNDSSHVKHFLLHPKKYISLVDSFIQESKTKYNGKRSDKPHNLNTHS